MPPLSIAAQPHPWDCWTPSKLPDSRSTSEQVSSAPPCSDRCPVRTLTSGVTCQGTQRRRATPVASAIHRLGARARDHDQMTYGPP